MTHHEQPRGSSDPKSEVLRKTYTVSKGPAVLKYPSARSRRPPFVRQVASIVEAVGHKDADHDRALNEGVPMVKQEEEAKAARAKKEEAAKLRTGFDLDEFSTPGASGD
jgi:MinD-like ATPase involved in chromosome partitioning or flagellar assembly